MQGTAAHPVPFMQNCTCTAKRTLFESYARISPDLETCLAPASGYLSPLANLDATSVTVVAEPSAFWRDLRMVLSKRNIHTWRFRMVTDAFLFEAAKPKAFKRAGDDDDSDDSSPDSGTEENHADAVLPPDLLVIRVGYELSYPKVDEVLQACRLRAAQSRPTWVWVDGTGNWAAKPELQRWINNHKTVKVTL